jgi:hypothetical protein
MRIEQDLDAPGVDRRDRIRQVAGAVRQAAVHHQQAIGTNDEANVAAGAREHRDAFGQLHRRNGRRRRRLARRGERERA